MASHMNQQIPDIEKMTLGRFDVYYHLLVKNINNDNQEKGEKDGNISLDEVDSSKLSDLINKGAMNVRAK